MHKNDGIEKAKGVPVVKAVGKSALTRSDAPLGLVIPPYADDYPRLGKFEVRCVMLQIAYMESEFNHSLQIGDYYGRYKVNKRLLKKYGFLDDAENWTGLNDIQDSDAFLSSAGLQDLIMQDFLEESYTRLCRINGIRPSDTPDIAAGMLVLAYAFRDHHDPHRIAAHWRNTGTSEDDARKPGTVYFNAGRYALTSLALN